MRNVRITICVMVIILVMSAGQGFGLIQFKDGGTYNIDYTINDDVWVDYLAPVVCKLRLIYLMGERFPLPVDCKDIMTAG